MSPQRPPVYPSCDATGCVGVVGALRVAITEAVVGAGQPALSTLRTTLFVPPGRAMLRNLSSQHHRAPTPTVKTP